MRRLRPQSPGLPVGLIVATAMVGLPLTACPIAAAAGDLAERHLRLLADHCGKCHAGAEPEANFRIDDLSPAIADLATAERWQKILGALNAGEMPPEGEPAVPDAAKTDFLDDLAHALVAARKRLNDAVGPTPMRRLNQREYVATLRDLLGVEVGAHELPADTGLGTFDTIAANLTISSDQVAIYLAIAEEALRDAFAQRGDDAERRLRVEAETRVPLLREMVRIKEEQTAQAQAWLRAIRATIARAERPDEPLDDTAPVDAGLFWHWIGIEGWKKYPDPPLSDRFGFTQTPYGSTDPAQEKGRVNSAIHALQDRHLLYKKYIGDYYLKQPDLDRGAYFAPHLAFAIGWPYAFVISAPKEWPAGDYVVRFRVAATPQAAPGERFLEFGVQDGPQPEKELLGTGVVSSSYGDSAVALSVHEVTGTMDAPQVIEVPVPVNRGQQWRRHFFIRVKGSMFRADRGGNPASQRIAGGRFAAAQGRNGIGSEVAVWVDWLEVERLRPSRGPLPDGLATLVPLRFTDGGFTPDDEALRSAFAAFADLACRGLPPGADLLDRLVARYRARRAAGDGNPRALAAALAPLLASPAFLYLAEPAAAGPRPLGDRELATRLAYFLWGGPPDAELRDLAARGELARADVLAAQTDRLLDDPRSLQFVRPFVHQWLGMDRLEFYSFNRGLFPELDDGTILATKEEVFQTVAHALRHDEPVDRLLKADYAVINSTLALYYGIPGVGGDEFRKVPLPAGSPRGGLLGTAAVLAMGGDGSRTNPVERGAWVLRKLLNDPPPPAPPNVPQIARLAGQALTTRDRVRLHQEAPQCASCHRQIDPIGFGLENFDAGGRWRTEDEYQAVDANGRRIDGALTKWTIDASGALHRGPGFQDYFELRDVIAARAPAFGRGFATALVEYALGRPCGFDEEPLVEAIATRAEGRGRAIREYIRALVTSPQFRAK